MAEESSSDDECPQLVSVDQQQPTCREKVPVTIITGFLGKN